MLGYLYISIYILFSAYSFIFVVLVSEGYSKIVTLFFSSLIGTIFFHLINSAHISNVYHRIKKNLFSVIGLNLSSGIGWLTAILALDYVDPATMLCINAGSIPIFNFLLVTKPKDYRSNYPVLIAILAVICSIGLIIRENIRLLAGTVPATTFYIGVLLSLTDGLASAFNGIFSERLTRSGIRPKEVLTFRFMLLIFLTGILAWIKGSFAPINWSAAKSFFLASCLMMIIPLILYQKGIAALGSLVVAILMPFIPICAYLMQIKTGKYLFDWYVCFAVITCSVTLLIMNILTYIRKK
ncbi:MAG: EamA family transporter [Bacteroidota bacterium]